jgi:hypothetical protein
VAGFHTHTGGPAVSLFPTMLAFRPFGETRATPSIPSQTSLTSTADEELREAVIRSLMGGLREKAYHHQRTESPVFWRGFFIAPWDKPRARPFGKTYPAGRALLRGVVKS